MILFEYYYFDRMYKGKNDQIRPNYFIEENSFIDLIKINAFLILIISA